MRGRTNGEKKKKRREMGREKDGEINNAGI